MWTKVDNGEGRLQQSDADWLQLASVLYYVFLCQQVQNGKQKSHTIKTKITGNALITATINCRSIL